MNPIANQPWPQLLKRLFAALLVLLFVVLLSIGALVSVLRDAGGRVWLLHGGLAMLNRLVPTLHIDVDKAVSAEIGEWRFKRLVVTYDQQALLSMTDVQLRFDWQALLDKQLLVEYLRATTVAVHQQPGSAAAADEKSTELLPLFDVRPWLVVVDELEVQQFSYLSATDAQALLPEMYLRSRFGLWQDNVPLHGELSGYSLQRGNFSASPRLDFSVSSEVYSADRLQLRLDVREPAGGWFAARVGLPTDQALQIKASARVQGENSNILIQDTDVSFPWQGHACELRGELLLSRDFSAAELRQGTLFIDRLQQSLSVSWQQAAIDAELSLQQLPLDILTPWFSPLEAGSYSGKLRIEGELDNPRVIANGAYQFTLHESSGRWHAAGNVDGSYHFPHITLSAATLALDWQLESQQASGYVAARGAIDMDTPRLALEGSARQLDSWLVTSLLHRFDIVEPEWLRALHVTADLTQIVIDGELTNELRNTQLQLVGNLTGSYADQALQLSLDATGSWPDFVLKQTELQYAGARLMLDGRVDIFAANNDFHASVQQFSLDSVRLPPIAYPLTEDLTGVLNADITVRGELLKPQTRFALQGEVQHVQLAYPVQLVATGHSLPRQVVVDELKLNVVDQSQSLAWLLLQGEMDTRTSVPAMRWQLQTEDFPMDLAESFGWPDSGARLSSKLQLQLPGAEQLDAQWFSGAQLLGAFDYRSGQVDLDMGSEEPKYNGIRWHGSLGDSADHANVMLQSQLDFTGSAGAERAGELNLHFQKDALAKFSLHQSELPKVALQTRLDLRSVEFLLPPGTDLAGMLIADVELSNKAGNMMLNGRLDVTDALLASDDLGLTLRPITIAAEANGEQLYLQQLDAEDGRGGSLHATGTINWQDPQSASAVTIELTAEQLSLLEREEIQGEISGALRLFGSLQHWQLAGDLLVEPLNVSIDNSAPGADIPSIDVSYQDKTVVEEAPGWQPVLDFNVDFRAEKRAFLRGRSLNAELGGKLHLGGNLQHPEVSGNFAVVRGYFELLGHRFVLTEGNASISEESLTVLASGKLDKNGTEITAVLAATNEQVTFTLTSNPVMPEDEILAWMMFGKSMSNVSAAQAVQLASALSALRGGGFDPIGSTREMLGVDTLTLDTEETANGTAVSVGAGKYLTDKVYLELKRTPDPAEPWRTNITIELSPRLSLRSTLSTGTASEGVELEWRRDY